MLVKTQLQILLLGMILIGVFLKVLVSLLGAGGLAGFLLALGVGGAKRKLLKQSADPRALAGHSESGSIIGQIETQLDDRLRGSNVPQRVSVDTGDGSFEVSALVNESGDLRLRMLDSEVGGSNDGYHQWIITNGSIEYEGFQPTAKGADRESVGLEKTTEGDTQEVEVVELDSSGDSSLSSSPQENESNSTSTEVGSGPSPLSEGPLQESTVNQAEAPESRGLGSQAQDADLDSRAAEVRPEASVNQDVQTTLPGATVPGGTRRSVSLGDGSISVTTTEEGKIQTFNTRTAKEIKPSSRQYRPAVTAYFAENAQAIDAEDRSVTDDSNLQIEEYPQFVAQSSTNPIEILEAHETARQLSEELSTDDPFVNAIREAAPFSTRSFDSFGDPSVRKDDRIQLRWLGRRGVDIDVAARQISEKVNREVTPQEIVDYLVENPSGTNQFEGDMADLRARFTEVTGVELSESFANELVSDLFEGALGLVQIVILLKYHLSLRQSLMIPFG